MIQILLLIYFVFGTVKTEEILPRFDCSHHKGGCMLNKQLIYATENQWTITVTSLVSGIKERGLLGYPDYYLDYGESGKYCMKLVGGIPFGAENIGFKLKFSSIVPANNFNVTLDGVVQYAAHVASTDWTQQTVDLVSDCSTLEVCIENEAAYLIKDIYLQVCTKPNTENVTGVLPMPVFNCNNGGQCLNKNTLIFATKEQWNFYWLNDGETDIVFDENGEALSGGNGAKYMPALSKFCGIVSTGGPIALARIGFYINYGINSPKTFEITSGTESYEGEAEGNGWEEFNIDQNTPCNSYGICIKTTSDAWIKGIYIQICSGAELETINHTCDDMEIFQESVASGQSSECPAPPAVSTEFEPHVILEVTNAQYVLFACLDEAGCEINWDLQIITLEGSYVVTGGNIGKCFKVRIYIYWYPGVMYSVDNMDLSVCAQSAHYNYHICEMNEGTTTPAA